ncbi:hypothetical protein [uncultured Actinobacillus sp.]|uniref:hypothetical protein n=1 Tax=uncultured Actinobacillus sp. TaxID=417616 RepID=UPI0025D292F6|nr:hypothetical protein [uncultured Actinobacillus sp.]
MKKLLSLFVISLFLTACSNQPHWQPIQDKYYQAMEEQDRIYNGKIMDTLLKASEELYATNTYATPEEKKLIHLGQLLIRDAIMEAKQDIRNYPLENSFMKAYRRFELVKQGKITFAQSAQLAKRDEIETRQAQEAAARQQAAFEQARWNTMTRHIGQGLGKTPAQIHMQQQGPIFRQTNCNPNYNGGFSCMSY